ncbi:MAG TPA: ABC transporter permease [Anaerolineae bacterium]|nr:ABC transporter permease [Anaerolineae bacterium]
MSTINPVLDKETEEAQRYYSASQWQLVWWRFKKHRVALLGGLVLLFMFLSGLFAEFIGPYGGSTRNIEYLLGPPQIPRFWDENGFSLRPFVYGVTTERDPETLALIPVTDTDQRNYIFFFIEGEPYELLGVIESNIHLFGVQEGFVHLFGTDSLGQDLFSRILIGTRTSLSIGVLGVLISFFLALFIGGVAGYAGGWLDYGIQRFTEIIRVIPIIPLYMGLAAAFPRDWSSTQVYFAMTLIIGLVGWPTLARRIRGQLLTLRNEDYVMAARLSGASPYRIISLHMLPAFMSYIVVDLVISFPYVILAETALSFIGLGLRPPSISWGVLLQDAQNIRAIEQAPWLFIPAAFVVAAVLAFTILGDGVRDAADPYSVH